jgi:hypothetical protein
MTEHDRRLAEVIEANGITNAADAVAAAGATGLALSYACALLENESAGRNIFGADPGGNALPRTWFDTPVTRTKYTIYKMRRNLGMTPNGVGPCQLTSIGLQKDAEKAGGCWKPRHNMGVGFTFLRQLQDAHGSQGGFRAFNGSGPAAVAYGERAIRRAAEWHQRFVRAGLA